MSGSEISLLILPVNVKHIKSLNIGRLVVNHAKTASLSSTLGSPSHLPDTGTARNYGSLLRSQDEGELQCPVSVIFQVTPQRVSEHRRFDESHRA